MSYIERSIIQIASYLLPKKTAHRIARAALASQGIGWACPTSGLSGSGEAEFLRRQISRLNKPCVFDVGANIGDYSLIALEANNGVDLHCFEPSESHCKILSERLSSSKVKINHFGLSETAEALVLNKNSDVTGLASLIPRDLKHLKIQLDLVENVNLKVGDEYIEESGVAKIDLIKIDVEGWEMSVLKGFEKAFSKKIIMCCQFEFGHAHIERRENFRDFYRFFTNYGYTMGTIKPNGDIQKMEGYDEIYENYYATNYVALLV